MSSNFVGVTFAQQKVSPSDDAIIHKKLLTDGILDGCALSYSGSTLTMGAGQLMICGRQIRHPAAQNWAVVEATSGYARLLLTVDLTRTATNDAFDQVVDSIEYASSVDGFPALEQANINGAGIRYQAVICVVSLGTGGISGIISTLGKSNVDVGFTNLAYLGDDPVTTDTDTPSAWISLGNGFAGTTKVCTSGQPETYGTIINLIVQDFNVHQVFVGVNGILAFRGGNKNNGWTYSWRSAFPKAGGTVSGELALKGPLILTRGVHYGTAAERPAGAEGQMYLRILG